MNRITSSFILSLLVIITIVTGFTFFSVNGNNSFVSPAAAETLHNQNAVVIVNSASADFNGFTHFIQPYLDHFGIPYDTLDIITEQVTAEISDRAVIIIGHRGLDPGNTYLDASEEAFISDAVNAGTGLVNFDNDLNIAGTPRYQFIQDIFGFTYGAAASGADITFADPATHYIIEKHDAGETITTGTMSLAEIASMAPGGEELASTGAQPFLMAMAYGGGRAVQFGSYDWISHNVKGPMYGLDDMVWRSIVWAARKPFAMQGLPPFVTFRMDDADGPFWWVHAANDYGYKPWVGFFLDTLDDRPVSIADLSVLVNSGNATASVHAFTSDWFFYFDNQNQQAYDDVTLQGYFDTATQWHQDNNIPISNFILGHYYELGTNIFEELDAWGVEFIGAPMAPGRLIDGQWVQQRPFREFESGTVYGKPFYYADYLDGLGLPSSAEPFFNCLTEIRDITTYEWFPGSDINQNVDVGTTHLKRALDSMALPTLFTHEYELNDVTEAVFRASLQGINDNIAGYDPIYVTMDYACQYARAAFDSQISSVTFDSDVDRITLDFSGKSDMQTSYYLFTEEGGQIQHWLLDVPSFDNSTQVIYDIPGPLDHIVVSPDPANVLAGTTQQFTAQGYDAINRPIPDLTYDWSLVNGGGSMDTSGLFTASLTPGTYTDTVEATVGGLSDYASVEVMPSTLDHFTFAQIASPQLINEPFMVTITARDINDNPLPLYNGTATLSDSTGTIDPTTTGNFSGGVWSGQVSISQLGGNVSITVNDGPNSGASNPFDVGSVEPICVSVQRGVYGTVGDTLIWEHAPTNIYGTAARLSTGDRVNPSLGPGDTRSLFNFDLSFLPAGSSVQSASFGIYAESASGEPVSIYRMTDVWSEAGSTWATSANAYDAGVEWGSFNVSGTGYLTIDLTALVSAWANGAHPNHGIMLINEGTGAYDRYRSSEREANGGPRLEVCYQLTAPGEPVAIHITPNNETIIYGDSVGYGATAIDAQGFTWDVTSETSFSIDAGAGGSWAVNLYTSENPGDWTVSGGFDVYTDTASLSVLAHGPAVSIEIAPAGATVAAGESQTYTATASDAQGNTWDVTGDTNFSIDAGAGGGWVGGLYSSQYAGDWTVSGDYDGHSDTASLQVLNGAAATLEITPDGATVLPGESVIYQAAAMDAQGNSWDVTGLTNWSIETGAGGSWAANVYTSENSGVWQVIGGYGVMTDTVSLTVPDHGPAVGVEIAPADATIVAGESQAYTATARDALSNTWDVTGETNFSAEIGAGGSWAANLYTGENPGTWQVTGNYDVFTDTISLTVLDHGPAVGVDIAPAAATIVAGESQTYLATANDLQGNTWDVTTETNFGIDAGAGGSWTSNLYTSANPGIWQVTGNYDVFTDTLSLTVLDHGPAVGVEIAPADATVVAGEGQAYTATASDALGNTWDVTGETNFSIDAGAGGGWALGVYSTQSAGDWTVSSDYDGHSDTASLHVLHGLPVTLEITPAETTVVNGDGMTYSATALDDQGNSWDVTGETNWSISAGAGGGWAANLYTSENIGDWTVTGLHDVLSGEALLHVVGGAPTCVTIQRGTYGTVADTFIWELSPNGISGTGIRLYTGDRLNPRTGQAGETRSLLHFDLSTLPAGVAIQSATFGIYAETASGEQVSIYRVTESWSEASANWASVNDAYDPAFEWGGFNVSGTGYLTSDLTALVAAWTDGTQPNYGIMLINNGAGAYDRFRASELSGNEPWLDVCYLGAAADVASQAPSASQAIPNGEPLNVQGGMGAEMLVGLVGAALMSPTLKSRKR